MTIKMLASLAGDGFSLSASEITDQFSDKDERRLIKAGLAEKHAPDGKDAEDRKALEVENLRLAENVRMLGQDLADRDAAIKAMEDDRALYSARIVELEAALAKLADGGPAKSDAA